MRAGVFVLGDIGRSPRMQYHAAMLLRSGADVEVIAFAGKEPIAELSGAKFVLLPSLDAWTRAAVRPFALAGAALRALVHALLAFRALLESRCDLLIVQTPPAIPSLPVLLFAKSGTRVIVDWHNLTSDVAARKTGRLGAALIHRVERFLAQRFDTHLTVSDAMTRRLAAWGVTATTFRDAPWPEAVPDRVRGREILRTLGADAGTIAITATSWSADEDFGLLFEALLLLEKQLESPGQLAIVITGDGPEKRAFVQRCESAAFTRVRVVTGWLPPEDFHDAIAGADLAFSLHRSASGLDLPMKIFDFVGSRTPVAALDYGDVLREIEVKGLRMFHDAGSLAGILSNLALRREAFAAPDGAESWGAAWTRIVGPIVRGEA